MPRSNISMDREVLKAFSREAHREKKTLYAFANEWVEIATKIAREGANSKQVYGMWRSSTFLNQSGCMAIPADLVSRMIAKQYSSDKSKLLEMFFEIGSSFVVLLKMTAPSIDDLSALVKDCALLSPLKRFDIVRKDRRSVELDIVGVGDAIEFMECTLQFLKAVLSGYGYSISDFQLVAGALRIRADARGRMSTNAP